MGSLEAIANSPVRDLDLAKTDDGDLVATLSIPNQYRRIISSPYAVTLRSWRKSLQKRSRAVKKLNPTRAKVLRSSRLSRVFHILVLCSIENRAVVN
ncbi:MAG: hypothetical protein J7647_16430 [Cyanobacteria bacterium SBLK]|nr:hypothetical protein [Cyanobacteria bacterium SBLK]